MVVVFGSYFFKKKNQNLIRFMVSVLFFFFKLIFGYFKGLSGFMEVC